MTVGARRASASECTGAAMLDQVHLQVLGLPLMAGMLLVKALRTLGLRGGKSLELQAADVLLPAPQAQAAR